MTWSKTRSINGPLLTPRYLLSLVLFRVQVVVIDAKGHLLGRLAAIVAKELLKGQRIVVVRTEELNMSGTLGRNIMLWEHYLRKRMNTNPRRGPFHYKAPARIFWRTVRGMIPHKTVRGAESLDRLKCFEGVPFAYSTVRLSVLFLSRRTHFSIPID